MSSNSFVTDAVNTWRAKADNRVMTAAAASILVSDAAMRAKANVLAGMLYNGSISEKVAASIANLSPMALKLAEAKCRHMKAREKAAAAAKMHPDTDIAVAQERLKAEAAVAQERLAAEARAEAVAKKANKRLAQALALAPAAILRADANDKIYSSLERAGDLFNQGFLDEDDFLAIRRKAMKDLGCR